MKHIFKSIVFILVVLMSVSVNAQNNVKKKTEELLIGTWAVDLNKTTDSISPNSKKKYARLNNQMRNNIQKSYSQRKLSFQANGQLVLHLPQGLQRRGVWKLLKDQKSIYIKMENGKELNQKIEKIGENNLTLNLGGDQSEKDNRLFHKWFLNKVN